MTYIKVQTPGITNVAVQAAGRPDRPPMILLHGFPSNRHLWRHCLPRLAEAHRVYAPDLPGYGDSDKPRGVRYNAAFYTAFLNDLRQALDLEPFSLVAHDIGGMVALNFAVRYPEALSHLIVMDTTPYADWPRVLQVMAARAQTRVGSFWFTRRRTFRKVLRQWLVHRPEAISDARAERFRRPWIRNAAGRRAFRQALRPGPDEWAVSPHALHHLGIPTLVLWAAEDRIMPVSIGRRLSEDIPGARFVAVPGCGHFLQEENPGAVTDQILAFIAASAPAPGSIKAAAGASALCQGAPA
jgi:pimeloyl-ACP methyl ester carboxylesterase